MQVLFTGCEVELESLYTMKRELQIQYQESSVQSPLLCSPGTCPPVPIGRLAQAGGGFTPSGHRGTVPGTKHTGSY